MEQRAGQPLADDDPVLLSALAAARLADAHPALLAAASHLLAVARTAA
ncbi:hypothetical protein [Streptacidiphilus sp. PAMC 29251]